MQALSTNPKVAGSPAQIVTPVMSVIIPTFNEALSLPGTLNRLAVFSQTSGLRLEVVIVDDGSPDGTGQIAENLASELEPAISMKVIHRASKLGLSGALFEGVQHAEGQWVTILDADNSHDLSSLRSMFQVALSGADLVIGSRYVAGGRIEAWPLYRRIISLSATRLARTMFGLRVRDPVSGFALMSRSLAQRLPPPRNPRGSKLVLEVLVRMRPGRVVEVPIRFHDRANGASKFTGADVLEFVRLLLCLATQRDAGA